jgi:hypothetical protein
MTFGSKTKSVKLTDAFLIQNNVPYEKSELMRLKKKSHCRSRKFIS